MKTVYRTPDQNNKDGEEGKTLRDEVEAKKAKTSESSR